MSDLLENIAAPPKKYRPMVRWWWPGVDVEKSELIRELQELEDRGFGGAEVQAFCIGTPDPNEDLKHRFAPHPYYFEAVKAALAEAERLGLVIDLTISSAWPPGGSWVSRDDSMRTLLMGSVVVNGGSRIEMKVPPFQVPVALKPGLVRKLAGNHNPWFDPAEFKPVAVVAVKPVGKPRTKMNFFKPKAAPLDIATAVDITPKGNDPSWISWDAPPGKWQIFAVYAGPSGMTPISDAKSAPTAESRVVDMFNEIALKRFFDGHVGTGMACWKPHAGKTLRALFTDSQEISCEWYWTGDFFDEFKKRRGYDVRPYLPVCYVPNRDNQFTYVAVMNEKPCYDFVGGDGERIRHDWEETLSDLFAERYCGGIARLARDHGLQHRIQAYGIRVDLLKAYGAADIPETEQLFAGGITAFLKVAGSAGIIYNKPLVTSESLVWMDRDYMTTPFKIKVAADKLAVAGINQMIYHGFPYGPDVPWKAFPGHYPWSPPKYSSNLNHHNPFWAFFPAINAYVTRLQYIMQQGITRCNVGVYYPHWNFDHKVPKKEDLVAGWLDGFDGPPPRGPIAWFLQRVSNRIDRLTLGYHVLGEQLAARGYFYTYVNDEALLAGRIDEGKLRVGQAALEVIIFPGIEKITLPLAEKLRDCRKAGIKIIFTGTIPDGQPGFLDAAKNDPKIQAIVNSIGENEFIFVERGKDVGMTLWGELHVVPNIDFVKANPDLHSICKETPDGRFYFIRSTSPVATRHSVGFREAGKIPYYIDLWTGKVEPVTMYQPATLRKATVSLGRSMDKQTIDLFLEPYGSRMIWFPASALPGTPAMHVNEAELELSRDGKAFIAEVENGGIFRATFSDGREMTEMVTAPPAPVVLDIWRLEVSHREIDGKVITVKLDATRLGDWRSNKQLRHVSGPGIYTTTFQPVTAHLAKDIKLFLDLGLVHDVAEVKVNGKYAATLLVPPYRVNVTGLIQEGENLIEVVVHCTLRNALVGYAKKGKEGKPYRHHKGRPLMPAGLIGPAAIVAKRVVRFEPEH
ncbi:MAG: glycosyl hydrolase [Candidatus Sigynarchaeota archaeon]